MLSATIEHAQSRQVLHFLPIQLPDRVRAEPGEYLFVACSMAVHRAAARVDRCASGGLADRSSLRPGESQKYCADAALHARQGSAYDEQCEAVDRLRGEFLGVAAGHARDVAASRSSANVAADGLSGERRIRRAGGRNL